MSTTLRPPHRLEWHAHDPLRSADLTEWSAYEHDLLAMHVGAAHVVCRAARPRIAHGTVTGSDLEWFEGRLSLDAIVITGGAAFAATPAYFATVNGFISPIPGILGPWVSVAASWRGGFQLRLAFAGRPDGDAAALLDRVRPRVEQTNISWIGIEPEPICPSLMRVLGVAHERQP